MFPSSNLHFPTNNTEQASNNISINTSINIPKKPKQKFLIPDKKPSFLDLNSSKQHKLLKKTNFDINLSPNSIYLCNESKSNTISVSYNRNYANCDILYEPTSILNIISNVDNNYN